MSARVTMSDVAKRAGVHPTTVSLALRNHPSLPESTRNRLRALADEMGYRPDPAMRALVAYRESQRERHDRAQIAYLTHWNTRWGWREALGHDQFHRGAAARADQLGYELEHFWLGEDGMTHQRMNDILQARGINGVIVASHVEENNVALEFDWKRFCAVKIDFFPFATELHNVTNDQRAIMHMAVERALAAGYRRIGAVIPSWWDRGVRLAWSAGFLAVQHTLPVADRIPLLDYPVKHGHPTSTTPASRRQDHAPLARWLDQHQPQVLISYLPFVKSALDELKISLPRDLAYVDVFLEPNTDPRIAGVQQNCTRVGEVAVELLAGQLQQNTFGLPPVPTTTLVEGTWHDGETLPALAPRRRKHAQAP